MNTKKSEDIIQPNTICLGNSYELIKKIPDKSVDLVYTDIPYEIGRYKKNQSSIRDGKERFTDEFSADMEPIVNGIEYSIFHEMIRVCKKINIYVWLSFNQVIPIIKELSKEKKKLTYKMLVWCKNNTFTINYSQYRPDVEYCLLITEGQGLVNEEKETPTKFYFSNINNTDRALYGHPTIKPLEIVQKHIRLSTKTDQLVLDPFLGSGTTAVACKSENRRYIGFEINDTYYKNAVDRLNGTTVRERESGYIQTNLFD